MNKNEIINELKQTLGFHSKSGQETCLRICQFCGDDKHHLYLNEEKLVFYCFKCGQSGTINKLARQAGITLNGDTTDEKTNEIKNIAAEFFANQLKNNPNAFDARNWLIERGINEKWLAPFQTIDEVITKRLPIGYHPGDRIVQEYFKKLGFTDKDLYEAGVLLGRFTGFNGSMVFPYHINPGIIGRFKLRMVRGNAGDTIWLGEKDTQTGVFGLNLCPSHKEIICVEGEFDALALQILALEYDQFLVNVVAMSGGAAALGINLLNQNGAKKLYILPDNDEGGAKFIANCLHNIRKNNLACIVNRIPEQYKDLDEMIQSGNHNLKCIFDNPMTPGEYMAKFLMRNEDFSTISSSELEDLRQRITQEAGKITGFDKHDFVTTLPEIIRPSIEIPVGTVGTLAKDPISARDLLELNLTKPAMIIGNGLLAKHGYTILASSTKMGKTTMSIQMCLCIAGGVPFLGFPIENPVEILYCDFEGTRESLATLLRKQIKNLIDARSINTEMLHLLESRGLCLENKNDIDWLRSKIEQTNAGLVVIDPISLCMAGDINDIKTVRILVQTLQKISKEMNNSWFLIHHFGKPSIQKREPIHAMLGSSGWGNYCEAFVGMERYSDRRSPDYKKLTFNFRLDKTPDDLCVYLDPETRLFKLVGEEDITAVPVERIESILRLYEKPIHYGTLVEIVTEELGVSDPTAKRLIRIAREQGIVKKEPGKFGKYYW
jgi:hypothetical protein